MLSVADFMAVQLFSTAALFILHRSGGVQRAQYRDLWSIILVYQVSAILSLTFDIVMKLGWSQNFEVNICFFLHYYKIYY